MSLVCELKSASFAGHETFPFRYTWLPKAVERASHDHECFGREDATVVLGVGKNMVRSMRHWALACRVLEEDPTVVNNRGRRIRPTALAGRLFGEDGWDPYLEDPCTLWLLHWNLCSTSEWATTWWWVFNHLPQPEFSKEDLLHWLSELVRYAEVGRVSESSLARDVDCFLRTYVRTRLSRTTILEDTLDCPFVELGLVREFGHHSGRYVLSRGDQPSLPDSMVAYALVEKLHAERSTALTLSIDTIAYGSGWPGRVFCLTEESLVGRLERLARLTDGALSFDETAGLRQLLIHRLPTDPMELLAGYYGPIRGRERP